MRTEGAGREGKGREGKGREGKGREGKGREGKGREVEERRKFCMQTSLHLELTRAASRCTSSKAQSWSYRASQWQTFGHGPRGGSRKARKRNQRSLCCLGIDGQGARPQLCPSSYSVVKGGTSCGQCPPITPPPAPQTHCRPATISCCIISVRVQNTRAKPGFVRGAGAAESGWRARLASGFSLQTGCAVPCVL